MARTTFSLSATPSVRTSTFPPSMTAAQSLGGIRIQSTFIVSNKAISYVVSWKSHVECVYNHKRNSVHIMISEHDTIISQKITRKIVVISPPNYDDHRPSSKALQQDGGKGPMTWIMDLIQLR